MTSLGQIGKYELLRRLAVGGMAEVFLARQSGPHGFQKLVVIKRILPHLAAQETFVRMFLDEARLAARFNHPNITQIYELGEQGQSLFIAMEYVHAKDLKALMRRCAETGQRLPVEHVVKIGSLVLEGLHYAHSHVDPDGAPAGVVHRDVTPHNVLVTFDGGVKLVDFGIAKARSQISTTLPGQLKGKFAYMAPEQCTSEELDRRADIFSLGIVMHELITGRRLFKRKLDVDTVRAITEADAPALRAFRPELDAELDAIIARALARDKSRRFQSAQEMQLALEDYLVHYGLKSNSVLISRFMADLFAEELAVMDRALSSARAADLEGAVLASDGGDARLDDFLSMFFEHERETTGSPSGESAAGPLDRDTVPTPRPADRMVRPTAKAPPAAPPRRGETRRNPIPGATDGVFPQAGIERAPPPKAPEDMEVRYVDRAPRPDPATAPERRPAPRPGADMDAAASTDPVAALGEPPDPLDPLDSLDPRAGSPPAGADPALPHPALGVEESGGWGLKVLAFLVVLALVGGALYLFRDVAPASTAAPETGFVKVTSTPAGADVYLDGVRLPAQTPTQLDRIAPGVPHTLRVTLPRLPDWEQAFTIEDTTTPLELHAVLSADAAKKARLAGGTIVAGARGKGQGTLVVESTPPGARIYLDGLATGKQAPHTFSRLPAGLDHVVLLEHPGRTAAYDRVTLAPGGQATVALELAAGEPLPGRVPLRLETEPAGAEVVVNGFPLKTKSPVTVSLLAGAPSELEVTLAGHRTWTGTVRPVPGVDLVVPLVLKRK